MSASQNLCREPNHSIGNTEKQNGFTINGIEKHAIACHKSRLPYILINKSPPKCSISTLKKMCAGLKIKNIHCKDNGKFCVNLTTLGDIESLMQRLTKGHLGFKATVVFPQDRRIDLHRPRTEKCNSKSKSETVPDLISRVISLSKDAVKHPVFAITPLVNENDYNNENLLLRQNDPKRLLKFLKYNHITECSDAFKNEFIEIDSYCRYKYSSGRVAIVKRKVEEPISNGLKESTYDKFEKILKDLNIRPCASCGFNTATYCSVCSAPICSSMCLLKIEASHKNMCPKGEKLMYNSAAKKIKMKYLNNAMPRSGTLVSLTSFAQSNIFFVRGKENECQYFDVLSEIVKSAKACEQLKKMPKCGQIVLIKSKELQNELLRAIVLKVKDSKSIWLQCLDYGNVELHPFENLCEINEHLANLPRFVTPVMLKNVPDCYITKSYRHLLYALLQGHYFKIIYKETDMCNEMGIYCVELYNKKFHIDLNDTLKTFFTPIKPIDNFYIDDQYLFTLPMPIGKGQELVVLGTSLLKYGFISCTTQEYAEEIEKFHLDFQSYGKTLKPTSYAPRNSELCLYFDKTNDKWCRGMCLERVGDGFPTIQSIDYGAINIVHISEISPYPSKFMFPVMTADYDIEGLTIPVSENLLERLEKELPIGGTINCEVLLSDKNNYSIKIAGLQINDT